MTSHRWRCCSTLDLAFANAKTRLTFFGFAGEIDDEL